MGNYQNTRTLEVIMDSGSVIILGFTEALIGYSEINGSIVAAYDQDMFIDILSEDMPFADAIETFHQNFLSDNSLDAQPIFVRLDKNI
jgi:hypothetical protein